MLGDLALALSWMVWTRNINTVFLRSDAYFFHCTCWCSYHSRAAFISLKTPQTSTTAGWAIQWRLLDAVSSKHSLSVLLSAMERSCTTCTPNISHAYAYAAYDTSCGYYSRAVFISLRAFDCKATIQRQSLFEEMRIWINSCICLIFHTRVAPICGHFSH